MRLPHWLIVTLLVASTAHALCPHEQGECLRSEDPCPPCPCPADEHGPVCALVADEVKQLEAELAELARGERPEGLCGDPFEPPADPKAPLIDVEFSSPDGPAVVGLLPEPKRVEVPGHLTLKRRKVGHVCALVNGLPALVRLLPEKNGKQGIELRSRPARPLTVTVKTSRKEALTGWIHAVPPFDWPDTEARPLELRFQGTSARAPDRVPSAPDDLGVWSVISVRAGNNVAAKLVGPNEKQVTLTPGPALKVRLSVMNGSTPLSLRKMWFADMPPGEPMNCAPEEGLARWGTRALDAGTEALVEAPPGDRRCLFVEASTGRALGPSGGDQAEAVETVGMQVPARGQVLRRVLQVGPVGE